MTVTPVLKINTDNPGISAYINEYTLNNTSIEDIKHQQNTSTKNLVGNAVKQQTASILQKHGLSTATSVEISDTFMIESITADELSDKAAKEISEFFGIPESSVKLRR